MKQIIHSTSKIATRAAAKKMARALKRGCVIALRGGLGSGKTVFAQGIASALGVRGSVTSPTFIVMNVYPVNRKNIKTFVHADCYRLDRVRDMEDVGIVGYMSDPHAVVLIEWAEKIKKLLPNNTIWITMRVAGPHTRQIIVEQTKKARER